MTTGGATHHSAESGSGARRRLRVVLLVTDLERGGTPLRIARLAQHLRAQSVDPVVGCLAPRGPVAASLEHDGVPTFACNAQYSRDWRALARLYRRLSEIQPDLLHATLTHANVAARIVGRLVGIPVVTSTATIEIERPLHLRLERWTARLDRGHIVNGQALATHVRSAFRLPAHHVHVVPPAPGPLGPRLTRDEARQRFGLPADAFVLAWAGRFDRIKRLDLLITAMCGLPPDTHLLLAGDGPQRDALERRVEVERLAERVKLLGWQAYLGPVFSAADAFVFPSDTEGMPNAVLQAMAFGLPIAAADGPPLRELAGDQDPPRLELFPAGDASAIARTLTSLRTDPPRRDALGAAARAWAGQELSAMRTAAAVRAIYERVLGLGPTAI